MKKSLQIIFKNNYPTTFKLLIDFFLLVIIFYLMNQIIDLPLVFSSFIVCLIFSIISVIFLYVINAYNIMFRYFNLNDSFRLLIGIVLSFVVFFIYAGNYEKSSIINQLVLFFISITFLISYSHY